MKKSGKICLVIPTLKGGGMERVMSSLANFFYSKNYEVDIVFLVKHKPFYEINSGINFHFPKFNYPDSKILRIIYWSRIIFYIRNVILKIKPDTVFSIPQGYSNLTIFSLLDKSIPVYISDRNSPAKRVKPLKRLLRKILYPYAKGIISQTEYAKTELIRVGIKNSNIKVIPNPLKEMNFFPKKADSNNTIINVGRLVPEKNQEELIDIFSSIPNDNWSLKIIGKGPLKQVLEKKIRTLNEESRISILDPVSDIDSLMNDADIFAFTSIYEGFPNSLSEALAFPLGCIAYDCIAGPRDLIRDGKNGFLVTQHDKDEYKEKLSLLMNDCNLRERLKEVSKENRKKYSLDSIGNEFLEFITASL